LIEDLEYFFNDRIDFVNKIKTNTLSYIRLLYEACDTLMPKPNRDLENFDLFDEEINV
jgi:DNA replication licensing factor MCM7